MSETSDSIIGSGDLSVLILSSYVLVSMIKEGGEERTLCRVFVE
jgi:hypothetical protein